MINYDDGESNLIAFYGLTSMDPTSLEEIGVDDTAEIDDVSGLSTEEQYDLLNKIIKYDGTSHQYQFVDDDLEDPLRGQGTNVIKDLMRKQVISSTSDPSITEYLISSREFNSQKFLTTIHHDTPIEQLVEYLKFLEHNIASQQNELKETVDENYINFVNCKYAIDQSLSIFKQLKTRVQQEQERIRIFNPSKNKANHAKDNRFLISEVEDSIKNLTLLTSSMIRPIKENKDKEAKISKLIEFINKNKFLFDLPSNLMKNVIASNHDQVIEDLQRYTRLKQQLIEQQHSKLESLNRPDLDEEAKDAIASDHQSINTLLLKIFEEVDKIIEEYRKSTYTELLAFDHEAGTKRSNKTKFLSLVDKIDQLNGDLKNTKSPINTFLNTQLSKANEDLNYQFNKFEDKFSSMQKKILDYIQSLSDHRTNGSYIRYIGEKYRNIEEYFKASSTTKSPTFEEKELLIMEIFGSSDNLDLSLINETWLIFLNFINYLSEVHLKNINKFVGNYNYYIQHNKDIDTKGEIRTQFIDSIITISNKIYEIFNNNQETTNQLESSPQNYSNMLPHYSNSLSTTFYISKISSKINVILTNFGKNVTLIGNVSKSSDTNKLIKSLRSISNSINQKILEATCAVWVNDCSQFYDLENWEIDEKLFDFNANSADNDCSNTKLINIIEAYGIYMLRKIKSLIFITNLEESNVNIVTTYPNKKMLVSIEIQFMRCLSILVDSIMKKYNLELQNLHTSSKIDDIFKVLTMNNFDKVSRIIYPNLIKNYDIKFDKDLSDQNLKLFSDIEKASLTILDDILSKEKIILDEILTKFFHKISNSTRASIGIDNFLYEILIHFVKLVYNIKPITNKEIFVNIIHELQNFFLKTCLDYFRSLKEGLKDFDKILINMRLDINFFIEVFESSKTLKLNDYSFNIAEIILSSAKEKEKQKFNEKEFESILIKGLKDSASQFDCLGR